MADSKGQPIFAENLKQALTAPAQRVDSCRCWIRLVKAIFKWINSIFSFKKKSNITHIYWLFLSFVFCGFGTSLWVKTDKPFQNKIIKHKICQKYICASAAYSCFKVAHTRETKQNSSSLHNSLKLNFLSYLFWLILHHKYKHKFLLLLLISVRFMAMLYPFIIKASNVVSPVSSGLPP